MRILSIYLLSFMIVHINYSESLGREGRVCIFTGQQALIITGI
jgi:hypothetical protein